MDNSINNTLGQTDKLVFRLYNYMYTASIAKEAASSSSNGGIIIIGMIIVIIGLVGFIMTKNK